MTITNPQYQAIISVPFGALGVLMELDRLAGIDFLPTDTATLAPVKKPVALVVEAIQDYLSEPDKRFRLKLNLQGSEFQRRVWQRLRRIPAGRPVTYGTLASELGSGPRAVGNACRANPCPLVVPCHRVVSASGLGGFAGQRAGEKVAIKRWLLAHEGYSEDRHRH